MPPVIKNKVFLETAILFLFLLILIVLILVLVLVVVLAIIVLAVLVLIAVLILILVVVLVVLVIHLFVYRILGCLSKIFVFRNPPSGSTSKTRCFNILLIICAGIHIKYHRKLYTSEICPRMLNFKFE